MKYYHSRKYTLNEYFFDKWTSEMAYVLGFWFADGYMRKEKSYRIVFSSNDYELMQQIRRVLGSSHPLRRQIHDKTLQMIIHSKYMYKKLSKLGGLRNKSLIMDFPDIPSKYLKDFIRGYFDGDGSVFYVNYLSTKNNKPYKELRSNFTSGSRKFLEKLMRILNKEIGLTIKKLSKYSQDHSLKLGYGTQDTQTLLKFIYYPNFSIGLKRKAQFLSST